MLFVHAERSSGTQKGCCFWQGTSVLCKNYLQTIYPSWSSKMSHPVKPLKIWKWMCFPYQFIFVQIKLIFVRRGTTRIRMGTEAYVTLWNDVLSILEIIKDYESAFDATTSIGNLRNDDGDAKWRRLIKKNINSTLGCRNCVDLSSTPNGLNPCSGYLS